jgi:peptidoglycan L-alanyl-D-glutamate endopeptidase CwlK
MYKLSTKSEKILNTCVPHLRLVIFSALATNLIDMTVIDGLRSKEKQDKYFDQGQSKVKWPNSKHNALKPGMKSMAVDIAPYVNGKVSFNKSHCCFMAGIILGIAQALGVKIRWDGNWDMDGDPITDQEFNDLLHFELVE